MTQSRPLIRTISECLGILLLFQACAAKAVDPIGGGGNPSSTPFTNLNQAGNIVQTACEKVNSKDSEGDGLCDIDETEEVGLGPDCIMKDNCDGDDVLDRDEDKSFLEDNWKGMIAIVGGAALAVAAYRIYAGDDWVIWDREQRQDRQTKRIIRTSTKGAEVIVDINRFDESQTMTNFSVQNNISTMALYTKTKLREGAEGNNTRGFLANGYSFGRVVEVCIKTDVGDANPNPSSVATTIEGRNYLLQKIQVQADSKIRGDREIASSAFKQFCYETTERGYFALAVKESNVNEGFIVGLSAKNVGFLDSTDGNKKAAFSNLAFLEESLADGAQPKFRFYNESVNTPADESSISPQDYVFNQMNFTCAEKVKRMRSLLNLPTQQCQTNQDQLTSREAKANPQLHGFFCDSDSNGKVDNGETFTRDNNPEAISCPEGVNKLYGPRDA